jgi:hypothetical protein
MSFDFQKEFAEKDSQHFWRRRYKDQKAQICVPGGNCEHNQALTIEQVMRLINSINPQAEMTLLAQELGCVNVHCVDFCVEARIVSDDRGDDYDPYGVDRDFYFLIAMEK